MGEGSARFRAASIKYWCKYLFRLIHTLDIHFRFPSDFSHFLRESKAKPASRIRRFNILHFEKKRRDKKNSTGFAFANLWILPLWEAHAAGNQSESFFLITCERTTNQVLSFKTICQWKGTDAANFVFLVFGVRVVCFINVDATKQNYNNSSKYNTRKFSQK